MIIRVILDYFVIILLAYAGLTKKSLGARAFAVAAPRIWNGLPLKTHYLS